MSTISDLSTRRQYFGNWRLLREDEVDLLDVLGTELVLILALGEFAVRVDEEHFAPQLVGLVLVDHDDAGGNAGAIEETRRQADDRLDHVVLDEQLANELFLAAAKEHAVGHDRRHVPVWLQAGQHVLDEHEVGLLACFRAPFAEAGRELQRGAAVVLRERRIGEDAVELADLPASRICGSSSVSAFSMVKRVMLWRIMFMMQMDQTVPFESWP